MSGFLALYRRRVAVAVKTPSALIGQALMPVLWVLVVGPALAAVTTPKRFGNGTLVIGCAGPVAMELTHLAPQLIGRINSHLGQTAVERLRFVQQASAAGAAPAPRPAEPAALPPRVRDAMAAIPQGELREALEKLAQGVYRNRD